MNKPISNEPMIPTKRKCLSAGLVGLILIIAGATSCRETRIVPPKIVPPNSAGILLPPFFSDNMVLQVRYPGSAGVVLWGWGNEGDRVKIRFRHKEFSAASVDKKRGWQVRLGFLEAGGPEDLEILVTGKKTKEVNRVVLTNVVVGNILALDSYHATNLPKASMLATRGLTENNRAHLRVLRLNRWPGEQMVEGQEGWRLSTLNPQELPEVSSRTLYFGCEVLKSNSTNFIGIIDMPQGEVTRLFQASNERFAEEKRAVPGAAAPIYLVSRGGEPSNPALLALYADSCRIVYNAERSQDYGPAKVLYDKLCTEAQNKNTVYTGPAPDPPKELDHICPDIHRFSCGRNYYPVSAALW